MGILALQMRLITLTNMQNDFEARMVSLAEKVSNLTGQIAEIDEFNGDLDPEDPAVRKLETEKKRLHEYEKKLEMQQKTLQTQMQEVSQEIQSCQQMISQAIQSSGFFSYGLGGR